MDYRRQAMSTETEPTNLVETTPRQKRTQNRHNKKIIYPILAILLWGGLLYGGYLLTFNYFESTQATHKEEMQELVSQNKLIVTQLEQFNAELQSSTEELTMIKNELNYVKEGLELTGETMTGSDETRKALQERMTELDARLNQLSIQLGKLEEAARAH